MLFPYLLALMAASRPERAAYAIATFMTCVLSVSSQPMTGGAFQGTNDETSLEDKALLTQVVAQHSKTIKLRMNQKCKCENRCVCSGCGDSLNDQRRCVYCVCDESAKQCDCDYNESRGIGQRIMQKIFYLLGIPKRS